MATRFQGSSFTDERITMLVHRFYARVQQDPIIGPVFAKRIERWPGHLDRMVAFWTTVLRSEPAYRPHERGRPPELHRAIEELSHAHFERWLEIFDEVTAEVFHDRERELIRGLARRMAVALSNHLPKAG